MDLLKSVAKRSFWSETAYVILNVILAIALLVVVLVVNVPWPALALVVLSKWRVFAVRSRYWMANIRANMVDTIVGFSVVTFLYVATGNLALQLGITGFYIGWLLFIKPSSKESLVSTQAAVGLILGLSAVLYISPSLPASVVVLLGWIVAYSVTRHVLSVRKESHINFLSLLWAFVVAEILWLGYHWTIGYNLGSELQIPQVVIIIAILSFLAERLYSSYSRYGEVRLGDVLLPSLLSVSVIIVLLFVFGSAASI